MKKHTLKSTRKYSHLSSEEREEIAISLEMELKQCEIAIKLLRSTSTISREISRNKSLTRNGQYRASVAQYKANNRMKLSHIRKRIPQKDLRRFISKWLKEGYSPEIIAFMASEKNTRWKTNYETIYQWIYNDRHDLIPFLTRSHKKRRKRGSGKQKRCPKVLNRTMIDKRPEYINLRSEIGHWEIDTAISRKSKAAIMVLVERRTRFVKIKKLLSKTAYYMHNATVKSLEHYPARIRQSLTYDNGTENAFHEIINNDLGTRSYFCNPYHSWEKGTVENIIGIIRSYRYYLWIY
jgi:IS30 family transposase